MYNNGGFSLVLERKREEGEEEREMKEKSEGRREKWSATLGGAHLLFLSNFSMLD